MVAEVSLLVIHLSDEGIVLDLGHEGDAQPEPACLDAIQQRLVFGEAAIQHLFE